MLEGAPRCYRWMSTSTSSCSGGFVGQASSLKLTLLKVLWVRAGVSGSLEKRRMYLAVALFFITNLFSLYRLSESVVPSEML